MIVTLFKTIAKNLRLLHCSAAVLMACPVVGALLAPPTSNAEPSASEYQVKAAFLLNFTKFIDWPQTAFTDSSAPFSICILGDDPFGNILDQTVEGETVNGRKLVVERLRKPPSPKSCQLLFISAAQKEHPAILAALGPGVLTVGEAEGFLRDGGVVRFFVENRRVRFDFNQKAAEAAALTVSSKLLNVARSVLK